MLAFSGLVFMLLVPGRMMIRGIQQFSISLHSPLQADYSPDLQAIPLAPVEMALIEDALADRNTFDVVPDIFDALNTPVAIVTPLPVGLPTQALFPVFPTLPSTSTSAPPTAVRTPTRTGTVTVTPTGTRTIGPTQTATSPVVNPTHTPTTPPTKTPIPPTPPTPTDAGYPPPPTDTQPPPPTPYPIDTPIPGDTPVSGPTATPIPPTPPYP